MPRYSTSQLQHMIIAAQRLGFQDDVAHWKRKLEELQTEERANHG